LEQEFGTNVIVTAPTVPYTAKLRKDGKIIKIDSPAAFPDVTHVESYVLITLFVYPPLSYDPFVYSVVFFGLVFMSQWFVPQLYVLIRVLGE
jgi:hypothetical protein